MKSTTTVVLVLALFVVFGKDQASPGEPDWSPAEREIWALEEQYMANLAGGDLEALAGFWHEDFLGWPSHSAEPVDRSSARASLENLFQDSVTTDFEIHPRAIHRDGDRAIACYIATFRSTGNQGASQLAAYRVTHFWIKDGRAWKVIGGMSARIDVK